MDEWTLNDLLECSVCLERLDTSSKVLPCQHTFCRKCLEEIVSTHKELRCPECRVLIDVKIDELPPNVLLMRILEGMRNAGNIAPRKRNPVVQRVQNASPQVPISQIANQVLGQDINRSVKKCAIPSQPYARAMFDYLAKEPGDLSFKKGDLIALHKKIDLQWCQGECNGKAGIFPLTYVQIMIPLPTQTATCKALYDFHMTNDEDEGCLTFKKDDVITVIRRVDENWAEGRLNEHIGIFPLAFVELNNIARALMKLSINAQPGPSRVAPPTPTTEDTTPLIPTEQPTQLPIVNTVSVHPTIQNNLANLVSSQQNTGTVAGVATIVPLQPVSAPVGPVSNGTSSDSSSTLSSTSSSTTTPNSSSNTSSSSSTAPSSPASPQSSSVSPPPAAAVRPAPLSQNPFLPPPQQQQSAPPPPPPAVIRTPSRTPPYHHGPPPPPPPTTTPQMILQTSHITTSHVLPTSHITTTTATPQITPPPRPIPHQHRQVGQKISPFSVQSNTGQSSSLNVQTEDGSVQNVQQREKRHSFTVLTPSHQANTNSNRHSAEIVSSTEPAPELPAQKLTRHGSHRHKRSGSDLAGSSAVHLPAAYIALYPYKPQKADELELKKGAVYIVTERCQDGWFKGTSNVTPKCGVFPGNYVTLAKSFGVRVATSSVTPRDAATPPPDQKSSSHHKSKGNGHSSSRSAQISLAPPELPPRTVSPLTTRTQRHITSWHEQQTQGEGITGFTNGDLLGILEGRAGGAQLSMSVSAPPNVSVSSPVPKSNEKVKEKKEKSSLMKRLASMKRSKSPPATTSYSMDNPVFDDPSVVISSPSHPVHTRQIENGGVSSTAAVALAAATASNNTHRKSNSLDAGSDLRKPRQLLPPIRERFRCIVPYPPNSDYELELRIGDIIYVHKKREDGWYKGTQQRTGRTGLFPASFVETF